MTVAAVILAPSAEGAVAPADGTPRVRRMADAAWAGGALPIVVVAPDPQGALAATLAGSEALLVVPADPATGPGGAMEHGSRAAVGAVRETEAVMFWPDRLCWVDAETVTSLVEAHGVTEDVILRPAWRGEPGWPVLVPADLFAALAAATTGPTPGDVIDGLARGGCRVVALDLGDPGCVIDGETPRAALPPYEGPAEPTSGHHHEWGAAEAGAPEPSGPSSPASSATAGQSRAGPT